MNQHHGVDVVMLVRHPMAFYYSNRRLGWDFDFEHLLQQEELMERHLRREASLMESNSLNYAQRMGLLWRRVYSVLAGFEDEKQGGIGDWVTKRHEDLCVTPHEAFGEIFQGLGISYTQAIGDAVSHKTRGNSVHASDNAVHQTERNSRRLATYWKEEVEHTVVRQIREIAEEVAARYYDSSSWEIDGN